VKLPAAGIPIYSCENGAHPPIYASGDGCGLMPTQQVTRRDQTPLYTVPTAP
jgi:hypothetical protein